MENEFDIVEVVEGEVIRDEDVSIFAKLSPDEAKQLTDDIKSTTTALYVLLKRAHDERAWSALGYKSWTNYIESEFDFSRARSYQLINQAQVIEQINEAAGVDIYLTEKEARDIKKRLPEITESLQEVKDSDLGDEEKVEEVKKRMADPYPDEKENDPTGDYDASDIDNSTNFKKGFEKEEEASEVNEPTKARLTQEEEFLYDKLLVTFKIFESIPDPDKIALIVNRIHEEKAEVITSAKKTSTWIEELIKRIS